MVYQCSKGQGFQITEWVEFDAKGRATCPCCGKGARDRTLSLVKDTGAYKCFRGCTPQMIREALKAPLPGQGQEREFSQTLKSPPPPPKDYTVGKEEIARSVERLLKEKSPDAQQARTWLKNRGIGNQDATELNIGLGRKIINQKQVYGAIELFIRVPQTPGSYYVKKRVAPWVTGDERPEYLQPWSQYGVPATIWFTYTPENPTGTWFCEGEWDAIRLGQLAKKHQATVVIACSTSGCNSVPKEAELSRLPGTVTIFYDRNDKLMTNGTRAGEEGAKKLALALEGRGKIAQVPMPSDCQVKGWDVSNALEYGYSWVDFEQAAGLATLPNLEEVETLNRNSSSQTPSEILKEIDRLIDQDLSKSELAARLPELARSFGCSERSLAKIYEHRTEEAEFDDARFDTKVIIDNLLQAKDTKINLHSVLPANLAEPLNKYAHWLAIRPESLLYVLLTVTSSLHDARTITWLNRDWGFSVSPNLYAAIVAPPSQKKSPIVKAIARLPLAQLERQERLKWKEQQQAFKEYLELYNALDKEEKQEQFPNGLPETPPNRRRIFSFTKNTSEGLRAQVEAYPNKGLLALPDELAGLLKSANAYRGGKGSDEEDLLSYYDGIGETVLRADGIAGDFDHLLLSLLGTIQPKVLQKFLSDFEDANGRWSRFMFVNQPLTASVMSSDGGSFDLTSMLADLYGKVSQLQPVEYVPEREAFEFYCNIYNELEQRRVTDPMPAMAAVWGKTQGRIGKLATNLHVIHELMSGRNPEQFIPKARFVEATQIALFSVQQVFSLYAELGGIEAIAAHLAKVIAISQKKGGWVKARDVQLAWNYKVRPRANEVRSWFRELEAMSKGSTRGEGRSTEFNFEVVEVVDKATTNSSTTQDFNWPGFGQDVGVVVSGSSNSPPSQNGVSVMSPPLSRITTNGLKPDLVEDISSYSSTITTNGFNTDEVRDRLVEDLSTKVSTNTGVTTNNHEVGVVEEIRTIFCACESIKDLADSYEIYGDTPDAIFQEAYLTLSVGDRRSLIKLLQPGQSSLVVRGELLQPMELFSRITGLPNDDIHLGDRVTWCECPGYLEVMSPFTVTEITTDGWVQLDVVESLVPLCSVSKVEDDESNRSAT